MTVNKFAQNRDTLLCLVVLPGGWVDKDGSRNWEAQALACAFNLNNWGRNHLLQAVSQEKTISTFDTNFFLLISVKDFVYKFTIHMSKRMLVHRHFV